MIATAMEGADTPTKNMGRNLIQGITIGAGAIRLFGTAVETFNNTIDGLNSQIRSEKTREEQLKKKAALSGQHAGAVETLQSAARTAKGQLTDPLDPKHVRALHAAGALPSFASAMFSNVVDLSKVKLKTLPYDVANLSAEDQAKYVIDHAKDLDAQFIALLSPAVRGLVAEAVAKAIRAREIDEDTVATLSLMKDDAAFAHRLYSTVTPNQMADAILDLSNDVFSPSSSVPPLDHAEKAKAYAEFLAGAGHAFATYTKGVGTHAPPQDLSDQWFRAITDETNPENAAALTMLIKHGGKTASYDPTFLADLTNQVYDWERSHDGRPVWGPLNERLGQGYGVKEPYYDLGKPGDPYDDRAHYQTPYDGLANLLAGMAKTPEAAQDFFAAEAGDVDKDKLDYLIGKKDGDEVDARTFSARYGSDEGDGLGLALEAATIGAGGDAVFGAELATDVFKRIADLSGHGGPDSWYENAWHVWPDMTDSLGTIASGHTDDVYRLLAGGTVADADGRLVLTGPELETVLGEIGRGDDKTGLQTLTTAMLLETRLQNGAFLNEFPAGSRTLDGLANSGYHGLQQQHGEVMGNLFNQGLEMSAERDDVETARRELMSKALDIGTGFLPGAGSVLGETASELAKNSYSAIQGEALSQLKDAVKYSPDTDGYLDRETASIPDKLENAALADLYKYGFLHDQDITVGVEGSAHKVHFDGISPDLFTGGDNPQLHPELYDRADGAVLPEDMPNRAAVEQAWHDWSDPQNQPRHRIKEFIYQSTFLESFVDPTLRGGK
ncbi:hypothetical protein KV100_03985 [Mumia sp. zg.B21]|uniref:hypothetical protein n=2 Tax=unclassified Mumia TaxID=2621872 RepID=UPI001C6E9640|nr:hypothetical protein [Mumia sp. zg.B21]MBW9208805.1 hypothetical protein [Mumia sp. zg.B21]